MENNITKDIVVFYHGLCRDGLTAAWAAWKKFGDQAEYLPFIWSSLKIDQIPPLTGKEIYFLDFTPTEEQLTELIKNNTSVIVVDHHVSKEALIKTLPGSVYDINHSGGVLAWQYFHPDKPVPQLCLYIEDSDIWKWQIPDSADILNYIEFNFNSDFESWDRLAANLEHESIRKEYKEKGSLVSAVREKIIDIIIKEQAQIVNFEGHEVYAINGPRHFRSEIGNILAEKKPPFSIVWGYTPDEISFSLRSVPSFDLIPLAAKFNGGGHTHASNFRLPFGTPLPWEIK